MFGHHLPSVTPETALIISATKDVILGIAAAVTAWVAVRGLNKWHHEMSGKSEYDAARTFIRATYRVREALRTARAPIIWAAEFPQSGMDADGYAHVYSTRFKPVIAALEEFETNALEAEALWGAKIREATSQLEQCASELHASMQAIVDDKRANGENFKSDRGFGRKMQAQAHNSGGDKDELGERIRAAVKAIEDEVRPRMKPK